MLRKGGPNCRLRIFEKEYKEMNGNDKARKKNGDLPGLRKRCEDPNASQEVIVRQDLRQDIIAFL